MVERNEHPSTPGPLQDAQPSPAERNERAAETSTATESAAEGAQSMPPAALAAENAKLREDVAFYVAQLQRSRAELENFRKRTTGERQVLERRAASEVLRRLLPVFDGLLRALVLEETKLDGERLRDGVRMITDKFSRALEESRVSPIPSVGERFDPALHEAVLDEVSETVPGGTVLEELERGYRLGDDLLRPARVKVARAPESKEDAAGAGEGAAGTD